MNAKDSIIPASHRFLPGHSVPSLRKRHREEKDPVIALRLLTYIKRKQGMSIRRICGDIGKPYATVRNWLVRAAQRGITGRHDELKPGRRRRPDEDQRVRLRGDLIAGPRSCGFESGMWTAKLLIPHIKKKYGVEYSMNGIYYLLHSMGFSSRKPRPKHPKSASESEKKRFKKS